MRADLLILSVFGDCDPAGGSGGADVTALGDRYRVGGVSDGTGRDGTVSLYPDARHEVVDETKRDEVTADVVTWLRAHLPS